jgi:hypothetical protein
MFSPTEDQARHRLHWRAALRNAAELVVAFATLDSYPLPRAPHGSPAGADAPLYDLDASWTWPDPHGRAERALPSSRRRGHGHVPATDVPCLLSPRPTRAPRAAASRAVSPHR